MVESIHPTYDDAKSDCEANPIFLEGTVMTYWIRGQRYREFGSRYAINHTEFALDLQGGMGHKLPKFLTHAKRGCKALGS